MPQMRRRHADTNLARARQRAGLSQADLARLAGVSLRSLQRIENGQNTNPPIRVLANLALVLRVEFADVCEPEWFEWSRLSGVGAKPPSRELVRQLADNEHHKLAETRLR